MNFRKLFFILSILIPAIAISQQEIKIDELPKQMSLGTRNSFVVNIPQAKLKDVTDDWKKWIRKGAKGKVEEVNGEIQLIGAVNKNVSAFPYNLFSRLVETQDGVQLTVWSAEGEQFFSTKETPDKSVTTKKSLHDFAVASYKDAVKNELEKEQKKQKETQKVYDDFVKDEKKSTDNISDARRQIEKLNAQIKTEEANIQKAQDNQKKQKIVVESQTDVVKKVSDKMNNIK